MSTLRIFMLGPIQFRRDEQLIPLRAAKAIALLAYLTLADAPQRCEMLADLLWPDSLPQAARKNLSNTLCFGGCAKSLVDCYNLMRPTALDKYVIAI